MIFDHQTDMGYLYNVIENHYMKLKIGITSGCFDLLHPMHVKYLQRCRAACDVLIVGIDTDELMYKLKGKYPMFPAAERAFMVNSLECVDHVFTMNTLETLEYVCNISKSLHKKVRLFKGQSTYYNEPVLQVEGVKTVFIRDIEVPDSTSKLLECIQAKSNG